MHGILMHSRGQRQRRTAWRKSGRQLGSKVCHQITCQIICHVAASGPFCQRVLLTLETKKVPYKKTLIDVQNKPQWWVPSRYPRGSMATAGLGNGVVSHMYFTAMQQVLRSRLCTCLPMQVTGSGPGQGACSQERASRTGDARWVGRGAVRGMDVYAPVYYLARRVHWHQGCVPL